MPLSLKAGKIFQANAERACLSWIRQSGLIGESGAGNQAIILFMNESPDSSEEPGDLIMRIS
jgi:hypothetical protein